MITFKKAFRINEHTVKALFAHDELRQEFVVEWNNVHPGTGEVSDYDLQIDCICSDDNLAERVTTAIRDGESGDEADLYIAICDAFDRYDCKEAV